MKSQKKSYQALRDIFIGAKLEGRGGFIKLMKIKSKYYQKIEEILSADINRALEKYPEFREELFDKLYNFFSRYFTESGRVYILIKRLFIIIYMRRYLHLIEMCYYSVRPRCFIIPNYALAKMSFEVFYCLNGFYLN